MLKEELEVVETNLVLSSFSLRIAQSQEVRAAILFLGEFPSRVLSLVFSKENRAGRITEESF